MGTSIGRQRCVALPAVGLILVLLASLVIPAAALAKGTPGGGGGGGPKPPPEVATNNLSVPTIMVGTYSFSVVCGMDSTAPSALVAPTGTPLALYDIDGDGDVDADAYYYVQGVHKWQAQCYKAPSASATAAWGDNLGGDASLKVGSPVRVELGLFEDDPLVSLQGYTVTKLEPLKLDRESAYGTAASRECTTDELTGETTCTPWAATASTFSTAASPIRVYDPGMRLAITRVADGTYVVGPLDPTAEINATGAVVYGYNWTPLAAGDYIISFTTSTNVSITGTDVGTFAANETCVPAEIEGDPDVCTPNGSYTVSLTVSVAGGGGGGGGSGYHGH